MDIIDQIKKVEASHISVSIFGFVGVVSPGLLTLFLFKRDLFISLDLMKLLLLSASFSLPINLLNQFLATLLSKHSNNKELESDIAANLVLALFVSSIIFYLSLVAAFFMELKLHTYLLTIIAVESIIIICTLILVFLMVAENRKKQAP